MICLSFIHIDIHIINILIISSYHNVKTKQKKGIISAMRRLRSLYSYPGHTEMMWGEDDLLMIIWQDKRMIIICFFALADSSWRIKLHFWGDGELLLSLLAQYTATHISIGTIWLASNVREELLAFSTLIPLFVWWCPHPISNIPYRLHSLKL